MAENIGFNVKVGMDVAEIQSELQKAENQLRQFQAQLKKSTNTIEINMLNREIAALNPQILAYGQALQKVGKPVGDASQSLINFSRIAQDAPYGIMGVANNLNPMVESFQRLAKTEGGTKKALQAMLSGLTGPAGIGVAIGVVSSLAVTFSKEIVAFFKGPTAELEKFREELNKVAQEIYKLIGQEQTKRTKGILLVELITGGNKTQREEALKQLQDLYNKSDAIKNAKLGKDKAYYTTLVNQAAMQNSAVANEKNNAAQLDKLYEDQLKNNKKRNDALALVTGPKKMIEYGHSHVRSIQYQKDKINEQYDVLGNDIKNKIATLEANTFKQLAQITLTPTADSVKKKGEKTIDALEEFRKEQEFELHKQYLDRLKYKQLFEQLDASPILTYGTKEAIQDRKENRKERVKDVTAKDNSVGEFLAKDAAKRAREYQIEDDKVKGLAKSYENFANMLASDVTNGLMNVFTALEQGKNPLDAIGQMFLNIAKNIAAAIIQATIFQAILTAFPELRAVFKASGVLTSAFGYSGPRATGGITNGPSMALVGEAGPEAIMPLSKLSNYLNTSFNAGAMSSGGTGNGSQFVLRGQDLLLSINRAQKASNLKGQNISLG
jgi:hypothetical protein